MILGVGLLSPTVSG